MLVGMGISSSVTNEHVSKLVRPSRLTDFQLGHDQKVWPLSHVSGEGAKVMLRLNSGGCEAH